MAITKTDVQAIAVAFAQAARHPDPEGYAAKVVECFEKPEIYKAELEEAAAAQAALTAEAVAVAVAEAVAPAAE